LCQQWNRLAEHGETLRRRSRWGGLTLATSAPLFAAYGQRGDPFGVNNLTLTISLLGSLVGPEVFDWLTGAQGIQNGALAGFDVGTYLAPFANALTSWSALRNGQSERFVTGVASSFDRESFDRGFTVQIIQDVYVKTIDLTTIVGSDFAL